MYTYVSQEIALNKFNPILSLLSAAEKKQKERKEERRGEGEKEGEGEGEGEEGEDGARDVLL